MCFVTFFVFNWTGYVVVAEKEFQLLRNLKHQNVDQQDRIKELHEQLKQSESNEAHLKENVEKLMKQTEVMLKKNRGLQTQCKTIARERSALATQLDEVKESNLRLEQVVKETSQTCRDLESQQNNQVCPQSSFGWFICLFLVPAVGWLSPVLFKGCSSSYSWKHWNEM